MKNQTEVSMIGLLPGPESIGPESISPAVTANPIADCDNLNAESHATAPLSDELRTSGILVLDDDRATTSMIGSCLERVGFEQVRLFNDSTQAVEFLKRNSPDLIVLDIRMPELDGISVLKFLRSQPQTQFVPVIVLTSDREDQTRLQALNAGANDFVNKPVNQNELTARVRNALSFRLHTGKIEKRFESVTQELEIDAMTGMKNRRAFDNRFAEIFAEISDNRNVPDLSLIIFDIDKFKETNDRFGHAAGDMVLKHIGEVTRFCCGESEFVARIGGDEFAILCSHADPTMTVRLAERIRSEVQLTSTEFEAASIGTTVSVGVARISHVVNEKGKLFNAADAALYQSKHQGRNIINVFSEATSLAAVADHLQQTPDLNELNSREADPKSATIFVVDDEPTVTGMLQAQLNKAGYQNIVVENDALQALEGIRTVQPDLVILDVRMPGINGLEILRSLREGDGICSIPVLVMTSLADDNIRMAALKLQANDFLTKPTNPAELDARVYNSLLVKLQHDRVNEYAGRLAHEIDIRTNELFSTRRETILCMARAAESRDTETGSHVIRVGYYAAVIARRMGLDEDQVGWIELAAQLHDVGKLSIPDAILRKPGKLTAEERKVIETHCDNADQIFFGKASIPGQTVITSPLLKMAARIASTHHEHWDGSGYPRGLTGKDIPIEGRITAVADVFDALSSKRCYKDAMPIQHCLEMIYADRGTHFDPEVVDAFLEAIEEILVIKDQWQDTCPTDA